MTIKEIEIEIQRLRNLQDELSKQEIDEFKEQAIKNVGRCFIVNGKYVKVIGIPQEQWQISGRPIFNRYQYPALFLGYDEENSVIPFYYDTLFSGTWGDGHDPLNKEVREISNSEFMEEFVTCNMEYGKRTIKFNRKIHPVPYCGAYKSSIKD